MSKENLISKIVDSVQASLGSDYSITVRETLKNNSLKLTGIEIRKKGETISPVIYIDQFISLYESELSVDAITHKVLNLYMKNKVTEPFDVSAFTDFESCKGRIIFQVINTERNTSLLKNIPSVKFLNFSIIYKLLFGQNSGGVVTATITNDIMTAWNVSIETVHKAAQTNTPVLQEYTLKSMSDIFAEIMNDDSIADTDIMYVLTNKQASYGCGCILYPHVLENFAKKIGKDFYILPSSIHEVLLVPDIEGDALSLLQIVREINRTEVSQEDFLSDNIYHYSRKNKVITII